MHRSPSYDYSEMTISGDHINGPASGTIRSMLAKAHEIAHGYRRTLLYLGSIGTLTVAPAILGLLR